jgi:DNA (cytosine-5)-methyltransferase 1
MKSFLEFFAGAGLIREGLTPSGWSCLWANDISKDKKDVYSENFGSDDFYLEDIWDFEKKTELIPDNTFLYTASFPCTDLSVAGNQAGLAGAESGTLNAFLNIVKSKCNNNTQPKVILLENVRGFLTSHSGKDVADTVKKFSNLGYYTDIIEVNAIHFSAQSRPRSFLIAVEDTLAQKSMKIESSICTKEDWWSLFNKEPVLRTEKIKKIISNNKNLKWGLFDIAAPIPSNLRLKDIVEVEIPKESNLWWTIERQKYLFEQMSPAHKSNLIKMVESDNYSYGTVYRRMRNKKSMAELRTDGFAGCLRTPRGGSSKQILIQAGKGQWRVRLLSPREYARLQGVKDKFKLPINDNKAYFAMGDAVCVPIIEYLATNILNPLYENNNLT